MPRMGLLSSGPRVVLRASHLARRLVPAAASLTFVASSAGVFIGCIDHLNNARVRSAEEFECKRADMNVVEVQDHIFVARGCGQAGAFRCETSIEGGCKRLHGKNEKKAIDLAPPLAAEDGAEEAPTKKTKKKEKDGDESSKATKDGEGDGDEKESGNKDEAKDSKASGKGEGDSSAKASEKKKSKKDDAKKSGDEE
jgi:type IV secretory pathway VirB10-like protein